MCGKTYPHEESLLTTGMRIAQHQLLQRDIERTVLLELCLGNCDGVLHGSIRVSQSRHSSKVQVFREAIVGKVELAQRRTPFKTKAPCSTGVWAMPDSKYPIA
jgi:hypothetical protein